MAGRGSLAGLMPYGDANAIVVEMAAEMLPVIEHTPVLAGVCASDPFRSIPKFLRQLKEIGFVGVQNFPTVGLIDGNFRQNLEETGMGYDKEVELMREAKQLGLLTTPYVFNAHEAEQMASVGVDVCVAHMGLTTSGSIGAKTAMTLDDAVKLTAESKLLPSHFGMSTDREIQLTLSREPFDSHRQSAFHLSRHHGPRTWRARCQRPRRPIRARPCAWPRRLLRCIQHGASSRRDRLGREHAGLQESQSRLQMMVPAISTRCSQGYHKASAVRSRALVIVYRLPNRIVVLLSDKVKEGVLQAPQILAVGMSSINQTSSRRESGLLEPLRS